MSEFWPPPSNPPRGVLGVGLWLVLLGGALITFVAALFVGIGIYLSPDHPDLLQPSVLAPPLVELAIGVVLLIEGGWVYRHADRHRLGGGLAILLAAASLAFPPAGIFLGPALGGLGGVLTILGPPPAPDTGPLAAPGPVLLGPWALPSDRPSPSTCAFCGQANPPGSVVCADCRRPLL